MERILDGIAPISTALPTFPAFWADAESVSQRPISKVSELINL
jgi:hypothetical protein